MRHAAHVVAAVVVALLGSCSSNRRLDAIEARLSAVEAVEVKGQARLEQQLDELSKAVEAVAFQLRAAAAMDATSVLRDRIEEIAAQVAELERLAARPAPGPPPAPAPSRGRAQPPDPADVYAVPLDRSPVDGPADALVTIVRGYEYACPYCEKSRATMEELRRLYPDDVRIVYRSYIVHPTTATEPALAACAAHLQGRFFEMDRLLWDKAFAQRKFDAAHLEQLAVEAGLDLAQYRADVAGACPATIQDDMADLAKVGQRATPTFFINGRYLSGAQPTASFQKVIDEELALAKQRLKKKGQKRAKYYQTWVLGKGKAEHVYVTP